MDNQLFYIKQILQLKEQANEAVKAIKFILNMKCFDPLNVKNYYSVLNLINDLEIVCDSLKLECHNNLECLKNFISTY